MALTLNSIFKQSRTGQKVLPHVPLQMHPTDHPNPPHQECSVQS